MPIEAQFFDFQPQPAMVNQPQFVQQPVLYQPKPALPSDGSMVAVPQFQFTPQQPGTAPAAPVAPAPAAPAAPLAPAEEGQRHEHGWHIDQHGHDGHVQHADPGHARPGEVGHGDRQQHGQRHADDELGGYQLPWLSVAEPDLPDPPWRPTASSRRMRAEAMEFCPGDARAPACCDDHWQGASSEGFSPEAAVLGAVESVGPDEACDVPSGVETHAMDTDTDTSPQRPVACGLLDHPSGNDGSGQNALGNVGAKTEVH